MINEVNRAIVNGFCANGNSQHVKAFAHIFANWEGDEDDENQWDLLVDVLVDYMNEHTPNRCNMLVRDLYDVIASEIDHMVICDLIKEELGLEIGPQVADEPQEDDYQTDGTCVYQYGKLLFTIDSEEETVEEVVRKHADEQEFWPNLWYVSDHGNAHLMLY